MKSTSDKILTFLLTPASWIYGAVTSVRNKLFDWGVLSQTEFDVPIVGIGNLTVGGTGKTPHTEYIASQLCSTYKIAVLSRGYKRKTRGYVLANSKSTPDTIGDEPWQIYNKLGMNVKVAVCESRKKGIQNLLRQFPDLDMILLDDSFQHRWVKPKISILLMEYGRPVAKDKLLPLGRLREPASEVCRADKVIITKCPENVSALDFRIKVKELDLMKFQKIYFSKYNYESLKPVFPEDAPFHASLNALNENDSVLLLTGIAHPRYFVRHMNQYHFRLKVMHYPDHHDFSRSDLMKIEEIFRAMKGERKIILTTEKDAVRLVHNPYFPADLKRFAFYEPISVKMLGGVYGNDHNLIDDILEECRLEPIRNSENEYERDYPSYTNAEDEQAPRTYDEDEQAPRTYDEEEQNSQNRDYNSNNRPSPPTTSIF